MSGDCPAALPDTIPASHCHFLLLHKSATHYTELNFESETVSAGLCDAGDMVQELHACLRGLERKEFSEIHDHLGANCNALPDRTPSHGLAGRCARRLPDRQSLFLNTRYTRAFYSSLFDFSGLDPKRQALDHSQGRPQHTCHS